MLRVKSFLSLASVVLAIFFLGADRLALSQDSVQDVKPAAAEKKPGNRLPPYYRGVVDEKQRDAIYKIQEQYRSKIDDLKAQLAAAMKERDDKIVAVLTVEQQAKIQSLSAAAKAKRAGEKPVVEKPAEK